MRILGFSNWWAKLNLGLPIGYRSNFTTFRFPRRDEDWQVGEEVQIVYKPRTKQREILGIAKIINKEKRDLYRVGITGSEARKDGFETIAQMGEWLEKTHGRRWLDEPMNKLTLRWINENP